MNFIICNLTIYINSTNVWGFEPIFALRNQLYNLNEVVVEAKPQVLQTMWSNLLKIEQKSVESKQKCSTNLLQCSVAKKYVTDVSFVDSFLILDT